MAEREGREGIPDSDLEALSAILTTAPLHLGVLDALDNWVLETLQDAARAPSASEWSALKRSPLDGKIGMSFALQWRYNFGKLFKNG